MIEYPSKFFIICYLLIQIADADKEELIMMEKIKKIEPGNFENVNGINYFRLEDGRIVVERTEEGTNDSSKEVVINSSKEDVVELITLEYDSSKAVRFWKTNGKIYALVKPIHVIPDDYITIPEDTKFVACYSSSEDTIYVKYRSSDRCGIIFTNKAGIVLLISHEKGYTEIDFSNDIFYADYQEVDNNYHIIDNWGKVLRTVQSKHNMKTIKIDGYVLFYDDSSIFRDQLKVEVPGGISSVEVIEKDEIALVKVINSRGIYYYTPVLEYLLGPIQRDELHYAARHRLYDACWIYETLNNKIIQIFFIKRTEEQYLCKNLSSKDGIEFIETNERDYYDGDSYAIMPRWFLADEILYVFHDNEFTKLIQGGNADKYVVRTNISGSLWYTIVGYQENIPVYLAYYDVRLSLAHDYARKVYDESILERIANGCEENSHICRRIREGNNNHIVVINSDGKVIISTEGENCYYRASYNTVGCTFIYIVEKGEKIIQKYFVPPEKVDLIEIFLSDGTKI